MATRPYLDPHDHAFANGPVFARPADAAAARALFDRPEDGDRLMRVFEAFDLGAELGENVRLGLHARLLTPDSERRVRIGANAVVRGVIRCEGEGRCEIGSEAYVGDGVIISSRINVEIGEGSLLAHGSQVFDNDTHPTDAAERRAHFRSILKLGPRREFAVAARPVRIGRDCWLGFGAAVMKGVTLGDEAIVAAAAMVVADVRPRTMVAGNPAREVRGPGDASGRRGLGGMLGRR